MSISTELVKRALLCFLNGELYAMKKWAKNGQFPSLLEDSRSQEPISFHFMGIGYQE